MSGLPHTYTHTGMTPTSDDWPLGDVDVYLLKDRD